MTRQGALTEFALPTSGSGPYEIAAGADGNMWFSEYPGDRVGRLVIAGRALNRPS